MKYLLTLFITFLPIFSSGQSNNYFERITSNNGLSQNDVLCILQDQKGFLWFGTNDGLNRYDGYSFKRYGINPNSDISLNSNLIYKIAEDENEKLWIGTTGQGLNVFDQKKNKISSITTKDKRHQGYLSSDYIKELLIEEDTVWVGTRNGLDKIVFNLHTGKASIVNVLINKSKDNLEVNSIVKDSNGSFYIGTTKGLFLINRKNELQFEIQNLNDEITVYDIIIKNQKVILATLSGLFVYDQEHFERINHQSYTVLLDHIGDLFWAGTNQGLQLLKLTNFEVSIENEFIHQVNESNSLSTNSIRSLCKDHTGMLWIGTFGGGVNKYNIRKEQFHHIHKTQNVQGLSNNTIKSFGVSQDGHLLIGTRKGVNVSTLGDLQKERIAFKHLPINSAVCVKDLKVNDTYKMFIGTSNGSGPYWLNYERDDFKIEPFQAYKGAVFSIVQDENGILWLGTYFDGLLRFNPKTNQLTKFNKKTTPYFPSNTVRSLLTDSDHNLWVGTDQGLVKIRREEKYFNIPTFQVFRHDLNNKCSISHDYILTIFEDRGQHIWAGTFGGGLNKLEDGLKGHFRRYTTSDGLPNNTIKGILQDEDGNLWVATNKGLCKMNTTKNLYAVYDVSDGLQANEFQEQACIQLKDDKMFFGGINGLNSFYPKEITINHVPPKVRITAFHLWNKEVKVGEKIEGKTVLVNELNSPQKIQLDHNENSVSFEFSALHYLSPANNKYQYRLKGYQENWLSEPASRRFVNYTNLPPGIYTFEVRGANNDGVWSTELAQVNFQIFPVFWKTNWAYGTYFLFSIVVVFIFFRWLKKRREMKNNRLIDHLERKKEEEIQEMKLQFFTNISHEFRTPLTLISGPLDYLDENEEDLTNQQRHNQYNLMKKNSALLLKLVNQVLDFRKIEGGKYELEFEKKDIIEFIKNIIDSFHPLAKKNQIKFDVELPTYSVAFLFSADAVEKMLYNLLSNAFKFNKVGGNVKLKLSVVEDFCVITVQNSGTGISKENEKRLFDRFFTTKGKISDSDHSSGIGLSLTKSLVELHHGSIEFDNNKMEGAKFEVKIPMHEAYYSRDTVIQNKPSEHKNVNVQNHDSELNFVNQNRIKEKPVVLLVEDSEDMRFFLKEGIINHFQVLEASNGKEALEILKNRTPNLIISDIMMPVMDGLEFAKLLRSNKNFDHIPFIFLTAKTAEQSQVMGLKAGADDYICKPFKMNILLQKMNNIISYRSSLINAFEDERVIRPKTIDMISTDKAFLEEVTSILDKNLMNSDFNVDALVEIMGISRTGLYHKFKDLTGLSAGDYIRRYRLMCAHQYLEKTDWSIKEVMYRSGFNTTSYFAKCFKKQYGKLPSEFREEFENHESK
ncbi:hybrid sensor histidine kinase/response regulator transcription factor [Flammeovirga sp. EKP202]|uniref:hybrid sensor histidine kinase/response regulator transcription factor n=1 Tax=Flammeovirga sp. EKP202 TaxID=2770592 RepID=UPI00165F5BC0|nr:hybrid sensor histidine kinase/response regulator transcription factor [Flammeovirga sp. EKP202]MBD0401320.1 response regulator [Flammeovirga sp. EKP202]